MTRFETPNVAIVGAGEIGRGWAALCVAAGWPVTLFDADAEKLTPAGDAIAERVEALVQLRRAVPAVAEAALNQLKAAKSLLQAVAEADWIIEAVPDDLSLKVKTLHNIEQVARRGAVLTSSSAGLGPTALSARLEHSERFLVTHPLNPVELVPLVEVVPGSNTDPGAVEDVRFWLGVLGRAPVVFKKEVPGNLAGRLYAAVWRECIQLVLHGVVDVEDVDRALSVGPALTWAAAGTHLRNALAAGEWDLDVHVAKVIGNNEEVLGSLATWTHLGDEDRHKLVRLLDRAYSQYLPILEEVRDRRLARMLEALRE